MIYAIDPLKDLRWAALVERSEHSSVFHSVPWIDALRRTYGYIPVAYTSSPPGEELRDGLLVCCVCSWMTGRRMVSLPFSDHCESLVRDSEDAGALLADLVRALNTGRQQYVELRTLQRLGPVAGLYQSTHTYCFHQLDLRPELATLFSNTHKSSTQRKILRAQRERLIYETGCCDALLGPFYQLLLMTRRRHHIPPQPKRWFRNLIDCFGEGLQIRVAWNGNTPVASILTIRHKDAMVYKYGCSDARFHNLGGTHLLIWKAIEEAKHAGLQLFDLGRTEWDHPGLLQFKDRWGSTRSTLNYSRFAVSPRSEGFCFGDTNWMARIGRSVVPYIPSWAARAIGSAFYRHIA